MSPPRENATRRGLRSPERTVQTNPERNTDSPQTDWAGSCLGSFALTSLRWECPFPDRCLAATAPCRSWFRSQLLGECLPDCSLPPCLLRCQHLIPTLLFPCSLKDPSPPSLACKDLSRWLAHPTHPAVKTQVPRHVWLHLVLVCRSC